MISRIITKIQWYIILKVFEKTNNIEKAADIAEKLFNIKR